MKNNLITTTLTALTLAAAFTVQAADRHVPADYPTIQAAVNAASNGDTIHIAPGVYAGQTTITEKKLRLIGQPGAILRAVPGMARIWESDPWVSVLGIRHYSEVDVRGLTFEGERLAGPRGDNFSGVLYFDSAGSVEECRFTGFREAEPEFGVGSAIEFINDLPNATMVNVRVVGNVVLDSLEGILIGGRRADPSITFSISDNTITGIGPNAYTGSRASTGINILRGATGEVKRNTIRGFSYTGVSSPEVKTPFSFGIVYADVTGYFNGTMLPMAPVVIEENTFRDNQVHLAMVLGDGSTIVNNSFAGTAPGVHPVGIFVSGQNVQISRNRFNDLENGIFLLGNDPDYLDSFITPLGVADNVQLTDNRFCDVVNPITLQPQATSTQQGTLLCPFPEPVLDIASAVLLCWPEFEDGYVVETAPTPDGPWTPSDATPFLEAGQTCIAVATTGEQRYYRLRKR
jgi:nitrous oxidase accessory protein NosD